jgi:hypothetical protein
MTNQIDQATENETDSDDSQQTRNKTQSNNAYLSFISQNHNSRSFTP